MAQRSRYWSCSKFADWLRGTPKIEAGTSRQWRNWRKESQSAHPIRFWIAEEGLDAVQNFIHYIPDRLYDFKYYINNRFVSRTHSLTAHPRDIRPGTWCDVGNRFLPCLFNELVNYVEIELAWWHIAWSDKDEKAKYNAPFWATGWFRWRTWRCPQAGLDNLEWQRNLVWQEEECHPDSTNVGKPTYQAVRAQEVLELYKWWTEVYPNRPDPHDVSGWSEICSRARGKDSSVLDLLDNENETAEERAEIRRSLDLSTEIEERYKKEDEEMMIRLIKIRDSLWT